MKKNPDFINIVNDWNYGSIRFGNKIVCDGRPADKSEVVIFSHAHEDHVSNNLIAEAYQKDKRVLMSEYTRQLCSTYMLANLDYDYNLKIPDGNIAETFDGFKIKLIESKHILGSSQIEIDDEDFGRMGYSGDFGESINEYLDVDFLVLDSTYSGNFTNRKWTMEDALENLCDDLKNNIGNRDVNLIADAGLLQTILDRLDIWENITTVVSGKKEKGWSKVYSNALYTQPKDIVLKGSDEERELKFKNEPILYVAHNRSTLGDFMTGITYQVKNIGIENEQPINEINDTTKRIGLSSHATGNSIIEYVEKVNPSFVITDSTRSKNNSVKLAKLIGEQLGIPAMTSEEHQKLRAS